MTRPVRARFAPSPTGYLHFGTARTALFNYLFAKKNKGTFILRIEDTDPARSKKEFEEALYEDLKWLGLEWDEGPGKGGGFAPYLQSERLDIYRENAVGLIRNGLAYKCFCPQSELEKEREKALAAGNTPRYSGKCREYTEDQAEEKASSGIPFAIRFRVPDKKLAFDDMLKGKREFDSRNFGDFIIMKSDGTPSYHLAAVVDDSLMEVSHVIRGEDHLSNTARHLMLYEALGFDPPEYAHLPMILALDRSKLSKRQQAIAIREFKEDFLPEAVINYLALLGWSDKAGLEIFGKKELEARFDLRDVGRSPSVFDLKKMEWINREHLKKTTPARLMVCLEKYLLESGLMNENELHGEQAKLLKYIEAVKEELTLLSDLRTNLEVFFGDVKPEKEALDIIGQKNTQEILGRFLDTLPKFEDGFDDLEKTKGLLHVFRDGIGEKDYTIKEAFRTLRAVLTGRLRGPELYFVLWVLGPDEVRRRIEETVNR